MKYRHRRTDRTVEAEKGSRHQRQLDAHRAWDLVSPETETETSPPAQPAPVEPEPDGVRHAGGPWFEVVVGGEVVDKVSGRDAAEARLAELA